MFALWPDAALAQAPASARDDGRADAAAERQEKPRDTDWTFRWKDHPTLLLWSGTQLEFQLRMQGDLYGSGDTLIGESANDTARRRVSVGGNLTRHVTFEFDREITGDDPWRDVYVDYRQFALARIRAGKFKLPFSLDENTSATKRDFVTRSMAAEALAPGRDRGVMVHGRLPVRAVEYEVGVFEHDGRNARPNNPHRVRGTRTVAGRISAEPFRGRQRGLGDLHIAAAMAASGLDEGLSSLRGRTVLGRRFYTADALVNGTRQRAGLELAWRLRPFAVQAEVMRLSDTREGQSVENTDLSPLVASGWYLSGTWTVLEKRRRFGSLELAARTEALAFNAAGLHAIASASPRADVVPGARDTALTLGLNWSPNRWIRVQLNVTREAIDDSNPGSAAPFWSRAVRFQLAL